MKSIVFIPIILISLGKLQAQKITLDEVLMAIHEHNWELKAYDYEARGLKETVNGARAWMPPQVGFGQFMTPYNANLWRKESGMPGMGSVMLSVEQMIPGKKKIKAERAYLNSFWAIETEKKNALLNELITKAKLIYFEWTVLEKKALLISKNMQLLQFILKNSQENYTNNQNDMKTYLKSKTQMGIQKNILREIESLINQRSIQLTTLMGNASKQINEIDTTYKFMNYEKMFIDTSTVLANRSDIKSTENSIASKHLEIEKASVGLRPEIGFKYDHMIGFGGQPLQYSLMAMVKLPFVGWVSGKNKANIESIKWQISSLEARKSGMANETVGKAKEWQNEFKGARERMLILEQEIIPGLKESYEISMMQYSSNSGNLSEAFEAWEVLNETEIELLDLTGKALEAQANFEGVIEKHQR